MVINVVGTLSDLTLQAYYFGNYGQEGKPPTLPSQILKCWIRYVNVMGRCTVKRPWKIELTVIPSQKVLMGYRLEQPKDCTPEIYQIMYSTWQGVSDGAS